MDCWANASCKDARRVWNCNTCSGCNVVLDVSVPEKEMEGIEDPDICGVSMRKRNGSVTMVVGAGGMGGGGFVVLISSQLLGSVAITQTSWVFERVKNKIEHGECQMISSGSQS